MCCPDTKPPTGSVPLAGLAVFALAATAGVDYLLTSNCRHIANADLLPALEETLRAEGFPPSLIVMPEEFSDAG